MQQAYVVESSQIWQVPANSMPGGAQELAPGAADPSSVAAQMQRLSVTSDRSGGGKSARVAPVRERQPVLDRCLAMRRDKYRDWNVAEIKNPDGSSCCAFVSESQ